MTEFITEIIQETTKSINCKGKFVSWYWKNSKVLINLYVNFQKNILICMSSWWLLQWLGKVKCKTFSSDEIKNHLQLIVLIEGAQTMVGLGAIVVSAASVMMRPHPPHVIMTLSPVLTSSLYLHSTSYMWSPNTRVHTRSWRVQSEVLVIWLHATAQPSPQVAQASALGPEIIESYTRWGYYVTTKV